MTTTMHKRSIHVDAAVEKVFAYVKDPQQSVFHRTGVDVHVRTRPDRHDALNRR